MKKIVINQKKTPLPTYLHPKLTFLILLAKLLMRYEGTMSSLQCVAH